MSLARQIKRQIAFDREFSTGTVVSQMKIIEGSTAAVSPIYVVDVNIGSNRVLKDILVKSVGNGGRRYAQLGATVLLKKNTRGTMDIVGPSDRLNGVKVVKTYDFGVVTPTSTANVGFTSERVPYEFYQATTGIGPTGSLYGDTQTPYNLVRLLDGDGNPVI